MQYMKWTDLALDHDNILLLLLYNDKIDTTWDTRDMPSLANWFLSKGTKTTKTTPKFVERRFWVGVILFKKAQLCHNR